MATAAQLKILIDQQITDKTQPYSISNIDEGNRLKDIIDLIVGSRFEVIPFTNQTSLTITWTDERKENFGLGMFVVEALSDDGKYRQIYSEVQPDSITNTTEYIIDLGGTAQTGRLIIK
jgi:hypothetical protein